MKILLFVFAFPVFIAGQSNAFFETIIYFEDAIGNRDSVIVGHDPSVNSHEENNEFGEYDLSHIPFDSIFEVRGVQFQDYNSIDGPLMNFKKVIGFTNVFDQNNNCYPIVEATIFIFNCKNLPLKVEWTESDFSNSICRNRSLITSHILPTVSDYWIEDSIAVENSVCLAENDSFEFDQFDIGDFGFYRIENIEGFGEDTLFALLFGLNSQGSSISPCTAIINSIDQNSQIEIPKIYPNPTNDFISIKNIEYDSYHILNHTRPK